MLEVELRFLVFALVCVFSAGACFGMLFMAIFKK